MTPPERAYVATALPRPAPVSRLPLVLAVVAAVLMVGAWWVLRWGW